MPLLIVPVGLKSLKVVIIPLLYFFIILLGQYSLVVAVMPKVPRRRMDARSSRRKSLTKDKGQTYVAEEKSEGMQFKYYVLANCGNQSEKTTKLNQELMVARNTYIEAVGSYWTLISRDNQDIYQTPPRTGLFLIGYCSQGIDWIAIFKVLQP